ncbi:MAG: hypothetical protein KatS3mg035_1750 [Bacteroidia bacterium]|nr:MAG: hypothetical protein KatS3mg035_1750 [Bacteroidia bacterium]
MDNPLLSEIKNKTQISFTQFVKLGFGGSFLSLLLLILLDFMHPEFCKPIPNIYFWQCINSLGIHIVFLIVFPFLYLAFAIFYAHNYLLYLLVEMLINKVKYQSKEWTLSHIPHQLDTILKKIHQKLGSNHFSKENLVETLLNLSYKKIHETFMPSLVGFYIIICIQTIVFLYIWAKL